MVPNKKREEDQETVSLTFAFLVRFILKSGSYLRIEWELSQSQS